MDLVQRTFKVCDEALQSARLTAADIDAVILVGGPTRLPIIRNSVKPLLPEGADGGHQPRPGRRHGRGAPGARAARRSATGDASWSTSRRCRCASAPWAATPRRSSTRTRRCPSSSSKTFTTSRDGQEKVKIRVYQGESNRADECEMLGEFEFAGFRIGYRGEVKIEVTFEIDTDGIVNVSAADVETGQRTSTTISLSSGLSEAGHPRSDRPQRGDRARPRARAA